MTDKYKLVGKLAVPCGDLKEWAIAFERVDRQVAHDQVGSLVVSTVFLGLDHNFFGHGDPLLFETMIFDGGDDEYQVRTSTWGQAEQAHAEAVAIAQAKVAAADQSLGDPTAPPSATQP